MELEQKIVPINITEHMKSAYIDYSMSVIVSRALPDVRDGLKPVHRRVLYGMHELGLVYNKAHKKSARIVGEVLGKYHPHGDSSVYDTMVRMAQDWSLRYPLVDGQGNFGSVDGDSPAAMRYTEARLRRVSGDLLADLEKETVDFSPNFDDSLEEPTVLPTRLPNLLVNGASGIAVGMATNMLPHNLSEIVDGLFAFLDNPDITVEGLMQHVKAPDFPTGGIIYGMEGVKEAFATGRGRVILRGRAEIETSTAGRESIIITEIPYQVNKANLVQKIAELVNEKRIEGIAEIRDESDRDGMRIVIDLRRDASGQVVLSHLYKYTALQSSFGVNNVCLVKGRPRILSLKELMAHFVDFRLEVIERRSRYDLRKAQERAHLLKGILAALDRLDEVISTIRAAKSNEAAKQALMEMDFSPQGQDALDTFLSRFQLENNRLDEIQAKAILELRLQRLTGMERDKVRTEFDELQNRISDLQDILAHHSRRIEIIRQELNEVKDLYGDQRRTQIEYGEGDISLEDMIENEAVIVTISHLGYIKRTPLSEYRSQNRGGRGAKAAETRSEDFIEHLFAAKNHDFLLLFTAKGRCHWLRVYEIPQGTRTSKGRAVQNLLQLQEDDKIKAYVRLENLKDRKFLEQHSIFFATRQGIVKKTSLTAYANPRALGVAAIGIREGDELIGAQLCDGQQEILLGSKAGKIIRFHESDVRDMGRTASGVRGMNLEEDESDRVIGMICLNPQDSQAAILAVSEGGTGKCTDLGEYRSQTRGGKGVKTINISPKTGALVAIKAIEAVDDLMIINQSGLVIRIAATELPHSGRNTQGVKLISIREGDAIADIALIRNARAMEENNEEPIAENNSDTPPNNDPEELG